MSFGFDWSFGDTIKRARTRRDHRNRALGLLRSGPVLSGPNCQVITISGHEVDRDALRLLTGVVKERLAFDLPDLEKSPLIEMQ